MERVVYTVALGNRRFGAMAMGLARSLSLIGDSTPRAVLTDLDGFEWESAFDVVIRDSVPRERVMFAKLQGLERLDARQILFLDADSLAFKRLDPIFRTFSGAPFGVQGVSIANGKWYDKDIGEVCREQGLKSLPKFNSGLLYYERGADAERLFQEAVEIADKYDSLGWQRMGPRASRGPVPDEPCLALAMARTGIGRLVDDRENFSNSAVGLIGKLHLDVRQNQCHYLCRRYDVEYVEPYVFHAPLFSKYLVYWRQVRRLEKLAEYEKRRPFGYMPYRQKLARSIQRRWLRWVWRIR